jgi:hypothetical protein
MKIFHWLIVPGLFLYILPSAGASMRLSYPSRTSSEQVTNLRLSVKSTGQQAVWELTRLHQKEFPLASAAVGSYGAEHQVTLWVSGAPIRSLAGRMLATMRDKIAEGRSPFTSLGEIKDGNRLIYVLVGMGQKHFYFQSGKLLIWMAASPELADQALAEVLKFYP